MTMNLSVSSFYAMILTETGHAEWLQMIKKYRLGRTVRNDLGHGTIIYEGGQAPDVQQLTVWIVSMYGGMVFSDKKTHGREDTSTVWWMIAGPPELNETFAALKW